MAEHRATCFVVARDVLTNRGQQFTGYAWQLVQSYRNVVRSVLDSVIDFACRSVCKNLSLDEWTEETLLGSRTNPYSQRMMHVDVPS